MEGHIIAATLKHFEMENQESDIPVPLGHSLRSSSGRSAFYKRITDMLTGLVNLPIRPGEKTNKGQSGIDGVHAYSCEVLTLSLLCAEFAVAYLEKKVGGF